jgi:hypothetical protein
MSDAPAVEVVEFVIQGLTEDGRSFRPSRTRLAELRRAGGDAGAAALSPAT